MKTLAHRLPEPARWLKSLSASVALLLLSGIAARVTSALIGIWFPDRPMPPDLLFDLLPYVKWTQYLTDLALLASLALVLYYAFTKRLQEVPTLIALFAIMELLRAFANILTPLAGPLGNGAFYGLVHLTQNGEFPSGHAASVAMFYMMVGRDGARWMKVTLGVLVVVECGALLLSRGHYSIDIVGGLWLSYFVYHALHEPVARFFAAPTGPKGGSGTAM